MYLKHPFQVNIIRSHGYVCSIYHVTTEDGYILELHRIGSSKGRPVLLQHGLLSTDVDWVTNPTNQSLGTYITKRTTLLQMTYRF